MSQLIKFQFHVFIPNKQLYNPTIIFENMYAFLFAFYKSKSNSKNLLSFAQILSQKKIS